MELKTIFIILAGILLVIGIVLCAIFGIKYTNREEKTETVTIAFFAGIVMVVAAIILFGVSFFLGSKAKKKALAESGITIGALPEDLKMERSLSPRRKNLPPAYPMDTARPMYA